MLYLVGIAWLYVVGMMAIAEAISPQGSVLGAIITFVFYGLVPLAILLYILGTPARRRARKAAEAEDDARRAADAAGAAPSAQPDGGGHAAGAAVAAERKEA